MNALPPLSPIETSRRLPRRRYRWLPLGVVALGVLLSGAATLQSLRFQSQVNRLREDRALELVGEALRARLANQVILLQGLAGLAGDVRGAGPGEFQGYVALQRRGLQVLAPQQPVWWILPPGPAGALRLGLVDPPLSGQSSSTARWPGLLGTPALRQALQTALASGAPVLSAPLPEPASATAPPRLLTVLSLAVDPIGDDPDADRRGRLLGWLALPLVLTDEVRAALRQVEKEIPEPLALTIHVLDRRGSARPVFRDGSAVALASGSHARRRQIELFGQSWLLEIQLRPDLPQGSPLLAWPLALVLSLGLTLALFLLTRELLAQHLRAVEALEEADRAQIERGQVVAQLRLAAEAFSQLEEGVVIADLERRRLSVNAAYCQLIGAGEDQLLADDSRLLDQRVRDPRPGSADRDPERLPASSEDIWEAVARHGAWQGEIWEQRASGEVFPAWLQLQTARDEQGNPLHYIATFSDLSRLQERDRRLEHLAYYDQLTGLPNLRLAHLLLEQALREDPPALTVYWVDLDGLKRINDSFGLERGDQVLAAVAERLRQGMDPGDQLARTGGDEFLVIRSEAGRVDDPHPFARRLLATLHCDLEIGAELALELSACVGISRAPDHGRQPGALMQYAATALTDAKQRGRNVVRMYEPAMTTANQRRLEMESLLQHGLEAGELHLVYQPQTDWQGRPVGAECLLRWTSPRLGVVSPAEFIPLAEATGLIHRLGEWVLQEACRQARLWLDQGLTLPRLAVNLSTRQFLDASRPLPEVVLGALAAADLSAAHLELEITESSLIPGSGALEQMQDLAAAGIPLAVDDFGTGFSSLSVLHLFPISKLKIDRAFIADIDQQESSQAIVTSTLAMARSLGLHTLAEGTERREEVAFLHAHGCETFQGYYFSRPLPAAAFAEWLRRPGPPSLSPPTAAAPV